MKRREFEHTVRAAGAILGVNEVLVIGSQAIHASVNLDKVEIRAAQVSIETDISALNDPDGAKADLIDGSIGEASQFQDTFGYYAQGVTPKTACLPAGWRGRLIRYKTDGTNGVTALCLEVHDLWISKAVAARPKDFQFCRALLKLGLVKPKTLRARLGKVENLASEKVKVVSGMIS